MPDIAESVRSYLLANSGLSQLVGDRVYTDLLPQSSKLPAVSFSKISVSHEHTLSNLAGLAHCRFQFDCYSDTRLEANAVAEAIRKCGLMAVKGMVFGSDIRGARVEQGQRNEVDYSNEATDDHRYVTSLDLMVDYLEEV